MLTIEEYIACMKKKNKLDEFDFKNHTENMTAIINYVMDYFNNYLDPEAYDYEKIKTEQVMLKISQEIDENLLKSKNFIIQYYKESKTRIDRVFKKYFSTIEYVDLFYYYDDYEQATIKFCSSSKMKNTGIEKYKDNIITLAKEVKKLITEEPYISDFKYLDNTLVTWIKETYREYGVNLYAFAQTISWNYYEKYVEYKYLGQIYESVHINNYNHRYNDDPFSIEDIYKNNSHRPFINGKKGELEMLLMHDWVFNSVDDTEYWPEYVNLCVSTGRVNIVQNVNKLIPVINKRVKYPSDINSSLVFLETKDGLLKDYPGGAYILRLSYKDVNDIIWRNQQSIDTVISNLNETFKKYGEPHTLELMSPLRSDSLNEEEFFEKYRQLEKSMKKYLNMKITLVNGAATHRSKPNYLMQSIEDIKRIRNIIKELKLKLKFTIDINKLVGRKKTRYDLESIFNQLAEIKNNIVGIHLSSASINTYIQQIMTEGDKSYLNKFDYPKNSDFLGCLSILLNDNQCRYFVPEKIENASELEELVDNLLSGGFSFDCYEV